MKKGYKKILITILLSIALLSMGSVVFAQGDLGLNDFAAGTGLGQKSLGQIIAEVVRIFLSVLGVIALILILYGGFIWMTSAGSADKVAQAKKIIISAVIGLAIILSAFAITQFVITSLEKATGSNISGGEAGGPGGGGLPGNSFILKGISPKGSVPIRNVVVRMSFNHSVDSATVNNVNVQIIKVSDNSLVAGNFNVNGTRIEFVPSASCPLPNTTLNCFEANTDYTININSNLKDTGGLSLSCGGFAPSCSASFRTGDLIDVAPPSVEITYPDLGSSVSVDSIVNVTARAVDDAGISLVEFFADNSTLAYNSDVPAGPNPLMFDATGPWNTTGLNLGNHSLKVSTYDVDSNSADSPSINVVLRAAHCFNGVEDFDETGLDCGGSDCGTCSGQVCTQNNECASNSCVGGICVNSPMILGVSPLDGAPGTYITIQGKYFGTSPGTVTFLGGTESADDVTASLAPCSVSWTDNYIVAVVPASAVSGPIKISTALGDDATNDVRGPLITDYLVNTTVRPGICQLNPTQGKKGSVFAINGINFGNSKGANFVQFGGVVAGTQSWNNTNINVLVPVLSAGKNSVQVSVGGVVSNPVIFDLLSNTANTTPVINYVDPNTGPPAEYITIFGSDFGDSAGKVIFEGSAGRIANADTNFPASCTINFWHDNNITVKVPKTFTDNTSTVNQITSIVIERLDGLASNKIDFSINNNTPSPGICGLSPNNGPIGTPVQIQGERFGSAGTISFYNNVNASVFGWGSTLVNTAVPAGVSTGPVIISTSGVKSNSVNFTVSDCSQTPNICGVSEQCCGSSCISATDVCTAGPKESAYAWIISTGVIPTIPHVIEECSGLEDSLNPSPSPWNMRPGGNTVCVNAIIDFRFDVMLDDNSVRFGGLPTDSISLYRCTGTSPDECKTKEKISVSSGPLNKPTYVADANTEGIQLYPTGGFIQNTKYRVELTTDIAEQFFGANMEERVDCGVGLGYCYEFKTKDSTEECQVGRVGVSPLTYVSEELESIDYSSSVRAKEDQCIVINGSTYAYNWSSSKPSNADILPPAKGETVVINTTSETPPNDPALVTVSMPDYGISSKGTLVVNFADPRIVSKWPDGCTTACVNATVGAKFNTNMDWTTINSNNVEVYRCSNESCNVLSKIPGSFIIDQAEKIFDFKPTAQFDIDTFYIIKLNTLAIVNKSGVPLINTTDGQSIYSWKFKTRNDATPCTVNRVDVRPSKKVLTYITETTPLSSTPYGAPDSCSAQGQRLNPLDYKWSWVTANTNIVSLYSAGKLDVLPQGGNACSNQCLNTGTKSNASICGNGVREKGEDCDEGASGNIDDGVGCSSVCLNEGSIAGICGNNTVFNCTSNANCSVNQTCNAIGQCVDIGEDCDNGKQCETGLACSNDNDCTGIGDGKCLARSFDGCSNICLSEGSDLGKSTCGNNDIALGEECDDGNTVNGDGCSAQCTNEGSLKNIGSCGNGVLESLRGEDCDDGNTVNGDGCSSICLNEGSGFAGSICGNNVVNKGEDCDDGNTDNGDGCSSICLNEGSGFYKVLGSIFSNSICGDNIVGLGEDCDIATPDANIDPTQYAVAEGAGKTDISASVNNVSGKSSVEVACYFTEDSQCPLSNQAAGSDNCCYPRPTVINNLPVGTNSCRNPMVSFEFNTVMEESIGSVYIDRAKVGVCPAGTIEVDNVWCRANDNADPDSIVLKLVKNSAVVNKVDPNTSSDDRTLFSYSPSTVLDPNINYRIITEGFKSKKGVSASNSSWQFTTGADICRVDEVRFTPESLIFNSLEKDNPQQLIARAYSATNNSEITPINGIYDWTWTLTKSKEIEQSVNLNNTSDSRIVNVMANAVNGDGSIVAQAKIITDVSGEDVGPSYNKLVSGEVKTIVFICENPWPARPNFPLIDNVLHFSTYYCRDNNEGELLPNALSILGLTPSASDIQRENIFTIPGTPDAIGLKVYQNLTHLSPLSWYNNHGFFGTPQKTTIDGYEAMKEGRTAYINASNTGSMYTNMFVLSHTQNGSSEIVNIYNQILDNLKFNTNLTNLRVCKINGNQCESDLDCDVNNISDYCDASKDKLRRDTKRLADLNDITDLLEIYKGINGTYPSISAGTFLRGWSVSTWPSWTAILANDLLSALPNDPLNKYAITTSDSTPICSDPDTCWNGATGQYICPIGSHVYKYQYINPDKYTLSTDLEFNNGAGWVNPLNTSIELSGSCTNILQGESSLCGDGIVGVSEECDPPGTRATESCGVSQSGFRNITCTNSCKWDRTQVCQFGTCGDGIKDPLEQCDDGSNNGKYGFCGGNCTWSTSLTCGDGTKQLNEYCDRGIANGQYDSGCGWSCQDQGEFCGDNLITSDEECDGNIEKSKDANGTLELCRLDINGVQMVRTKTCSETKCIWEDWSECQSPGVCGNGVQEPGEQCDDGNNSNSDSCTNTCKLNTCGDGFVEIGTEICDSGANNGVACIPEYGLTCNYCSRSCKKITATGGYCGDSIKNGNEVCDGDNNITTTCKQGGYADIANIKPKCSNSCEADFSPCTYIWYRINAGGPIYKDFSGNTWASDVGYYNVGGVYSNSFPINNTELDTIYQSERYEINNPNNLTFSFPVAPGKYLVRLHFAEIWNAITRAGQRVFDVYIEDNKVLTNFDVYKEAGIYNALTKEFQTTVIDNTLQVRLSHVSGSYSKISGIEVILISY